jgi:beta-xylosidase
MVIFLQPYSLRAEEGTYVNPISDSLFSADPFVLYDEGVFYLYGTSAGDGFRYWTSEDLVDWEAQGYAWRKDEGSWGRKSFWAPEVIRYQERYYMIYSAHGPTLFGSGLRLCLAVSDQPGGPFRDVRAPLFDLGYGCIDGHLFIDEDETPYLYFEKVGAVGKHWEGKGYLWGVIMGVKLSEDLSELQHEPTLCLYPSREWEGINSFKARSTEGMTVIRHLGGYYMTYSANHYADPNYGVGVARAESPLGLWRKQPGNPVLQQNRETGVSGPGHNCIVRHPVNEEFFILYHSHANPDQPSARRVLNLDRLIFNPDSSISIKGPTRTPQKRPVPIPTK